MINGFVRGQQLTVRHPVIAADTINYLTALFTFQTRDWAGLEKWTHWQRGDVVYDIPLVNDQITEDARLNLDAGEWTVWVHGNRYADGEVVQRITTDKATIAVVPTGTLDGEPFPEMPASVTEQILARLDNVEQNGTGGGGKGTVTAVAGVAPDETGNVPLTPADIGAAEIEVTDEEVNLVAVTGTAAVGQTIVVDSVDEDGYPVSWHAVDMPEGGGTSVEVDDTLTQSGKAADAKAVGDKFGEVEKAKADKNEIPTVFPWAVAKLPFTEDEISGVDTGGGFVVNPTNFADGKTYFRYHAGASYGFRWTNPNPQKGALTITMRGYAQYATSGRTKIVTEYSDGTDNSLTDMMYLDHGVLTTYTTDPDKTVVAIRGNYDLENWVLLDMSVLSIVADYPAPTGTVKSVNGNLPDDNGNVEIEIPSGSVVNNRFIGKNANFLGDSQTDDAGNYKTVFFYDWLKDILGLNITNNYGYSGTTIMPIAGQTKSFLERYTSMSDDADLIVVWGGTNDYHYGHALGTVDDTENTTFCGALNNLCKGLIAKYPSADILFVTPTPRGNIASAVATQKEYADAIIDVCGKYCIPVFDAFRKCNMPIIADVSYDSEGNIMRKYTVDGLHLNDLGHEILGKSMANFVLYSEMAGAQAEFGTGQTEPEEPEVPDVPVTITGITATYTGGDVAVGTTVDDLTGITVIATYSDGSTKNVTGYTLSGDIVAGENTITVTYEGFTAVFTVVGVADDEETTVPASPVDGKTVTFTAQASYPKANNIVALVNASDFVYVNLDELIVTLEIADETQTLTAFGKGMQCFSDETGELNNGKYKDGLSGYITSVKEGNTFIGTAAMNSNQPAYPYIKIPLSIVSAAYPVSFKVESLTLQLNGKYIPIQAVGGFYANEGFSVTD